MREGGIQMRHPDEQWDTARESRNLQVGSIT